MEKKFLTTGEAAEYLGLKKNTLDRWRVYGRGPKYRRMGRAVRYAVEDLEEFASGQFQSTAEYETSEA